MTSTPVSRTLGLAPWSLAVAAMLSVQLSAAWSMGLIAEVGAAGTAWLRLTAGALIFLALARPPLRKVRRQDVPALLGLGVASGLMGVMFLAAIERIPLGTCVAIEFLGPLTVAAVRSHNKQALIWPLLALLGVVLLTEPWQGTIDPAGVGFAAGAAVGWGAYIVLTQRVGDRFTGIQGLALTVPIAAITTADRWHPPGRRASEPRCHRRVDRAGAAVPGPPVRAGDGRVASHDPRRVRHPDGSRTGLRCADRPARAAPETLDPADRGHPVGRRRRRRGPTPWPSPTRHHHRRP